MMKTAKAAPRRMHADALLRRIIAATIAFAKIMIYKPQPGQANPEYCRVRSSRRQP
jgi:hypothetical protein